MSSVTPRRADPELIERNTWMILDAVAARVSVDECADGLLRSRVFYETSGGVTFPGGEKKRRRSSRSASSPST